MLTKLARSGRLVSCRSAVGYCRPTASVAPLTIFLSPLRSFYRVGHCSPWISVDGGVIHPARMSQSPLHIAARVREALHEAESYGIGHNHEYYRNGGGCRLQGDDACGLAATSRSELSAINSVAKAGYRSVGWVYRYSTRRFFPSIQPLRASQRATCLEQLAHCRECQNIRYVEARLGPAGWDEASSAGVVSVNSRRLIRSSSQLEENGLRI